MSYQKYVISSDVIPQNKRQKVNETVLYLVDSGQLGEVTPGDIFNGYTGDGGLHGLKFSDFRNYHEFSAAKKEIENGQFFTSHEICRFVMDCIRPTRQDLVCDLTCGMGSFFNYVPVEGNCYGTEIDSKAVKVGRFLFPEANIAGEDIRYWTPDLRFDIVVGNPPFNLEWRYGGEDYQSQLFYFVKAAQVLKPAGLLAVIVPASFMADEFMDQRTIRLVNERFNFIMQFDLPVNGFHRLGVDRFETKVMFFQAKSQHLPERPYELTKGEVPGWSEDEAERVYLEFIRPVLESKDKLKSKLYFENLHGRENREFSDRIKKMLFHIQRHPKTAGSYSKCLEYLYKFNTQRQPEGMSWEEWEKVRITPGKVLGYLKRALQKQNYREVEKISLVKTNYGLKLKAYSGKTVRALSQFAGVRELDFNTMILEDRYPFEDQKYRGLFERKKAGYLRQNRKISELGPAPGLRKWLDDFRLVEEGSFDLFNQGKVIRLNERQKDDLELVFQKDYPPILNWQMGSGKTIAGIAWMKYMKSVHAVRNVFIVSPAISINLTWRKKLAAFGEKFVQLESYGDVFGLQPGQTVLVSLQMMVKYQRFIKDYIRRQSNKVAVIVDESDELTNYYCQQTRAALSCFRRVHYKLLMTGTTTRNNINELYPQFELLYNNSINFLNTCRFVYRINKEQEVEEMVNANYMRPFPAWRGMSQFRACFCPHKVSVFGIKKYNQDVYNLDSLRVILEKTVVTRTLEDIAGRKLFEIVPHSVKQNEAEKEIYRLIVKEFYKMLSYFRDTGNSRKESMLKIIRQIQLLIKASSIPHMFNEYQGSDLPGKYEYIFKLLDRWNDQKVAIGTIYREAAADYCLKLKARFPGRPVFLVRGDVDMNKRGRVIAEFEATTNGILVTTQQALKSSVNIPTVNLCIVESLLWNFPKIFQFCFRFIRFDSEGLTQIHLITAERTIEQNLLALLMAKERLNELVKTYEFADQEEIFDQYEIDPAILNSLIEKEEDEDGHIRLNWGNSEAC